MGKKKKKKKKTKVYAGYINCHRLDNYSNKELVTFDNWKDAEASFIGKEGVIYCSGKDRETALAKLERLFKARDKVWFGLHRGSQWCEVPKHYLKWLSEQGDSHASKRARMELDERAAK